MLLKRYRKEFCRPTCMVFAVLITEGEKSPENCPQLDMQNKITLHNYLKQFINR